MNKASSATETATAEPVKCSECRRTLRAAASVAAGIGPRCAAIKAATEGLSPKQVARAAPRRVPEGDVTMTRETYKGRKLKVAKVDGLGLAGFINGQHMLTRYGVPAEKILEQLHRDINFVDETPIDLDRWGAYMYAPGSYELCGEGHPKGIGEPCRDQFCQREAKAARS